MSAWFDPFSWDVWILLIIGYFVSSLVLCLVARLSPIEYTSIAARLSLKDSFWYLISCWFRASDFKPKAWSARLLSCCWWMFYITVIIIYFLHLPPHLATPTTASRPTTVQSVLDKDVTFGVVQGGSTLQLLKVFSYQFLAVNNSTLCSLFRALSTHFTSLYGILFPLTILHRSLKATMLVCKEWIMKMEASVSSWSPTLLTISLLKIVHFIL